MKPEPKISKHYATPDSVPALFDSDGNRVYLEHRHLAKWFLDNDYPLSAATKYIFRVGKKKSSGMTIEEKSIEDLKKAQEYIGFKIEELQLQVAKQVKNLADQEDYKSRFHGGDFPFAEVKCKTVEISTPKPPIMTLGDLLRERIREEGLEDAGDAGARYTNQG